MALNSMAIETVFPKQAKQAALAARITRHPII
jgi:hypothetical protein